MQDEMNRLRDELLNLQDKLTYFILSLSSASIAFALTQNEQTNLSYLSILQLLPIATWGISILAGYKYIIGGEKIIIANHTYLEFKNNGPQNKKILDEWIETTLAELAKPRQRWRWAQVWAYVAGAFIFVLNEIIFRLILMKSTAVEHVGNLQSLDLFQ